MNDLNVDKSGTFVGTSRFDYLIIFYNKLNAMNEN